MPKRRGGYTIGYVPLKRKSKAKPQGYTPLPPRHDETRQGDEIACSCGARWSVGETHP